MVALPQQHTTDESSLAYWKSRAIKAEQERDYWKSEFYLLRKVRRAPVLKPIDKEVVSEFRHVEKWGTVKDGQDRTRANFQTIANNLNVSPDSVKRSADRLQQLGLVDIKEHQGPQDIYERKYVHVKEEAISTIDRLEDIKGIVPKQGGNRYQCNQCHSENTETKTVRYIRCRDCGHETILDETEWKMQNAQNAQKQLAFGEHSQDGQKQNAEQCVYTLSLDGELAPTGPEIATVSLSQQDDQPEKQVAFEPSASDARMTALAELQRLRQWVCWCYEQQEGKDKPTKVPYNPCTGRKASTTDAGTWASYEEAIEAFKHDKNVYGAPYDGPGFVFNNDYTGIDFDHCLDPETGEYNELAFERIHRLASYAELSPSRTGVHVIARGTVPAGRKLPDIEMYSRARFFTWTGEHLPGAPLSIEDRQAEITALYEEITPTVEPAAPQECVYAGCTLTEDEVLEKARNARNSTKFFDLYERGAFRDYGYKSQSEADLGLCRMLAYYSDHNPDLMDALFRKSSLFRADRWDAPARAGETYGEGTIKRALGADTLPVPPSPRSDQEPPSETTAMFAAPSQQKQPALPAYDENGLPTRMTLCCGVPFQHGPHGPECSNPNCERKQAAA